MGLNEKEVVDNKLFWKTVVKPSPSSKVSGIIYIYIHMVFTTERFFQVAIESCPEWDLNPRPLNSVQTL